MANIPIIHINGTDYNVKDAQARSVAYNRLANGIVVNDGVTDNELFCASCVDDIIVFGDTSWLSGSKLHIIINTVSFPKKVVVTTSTNSVADLAYNTVTGYSEYYKDGTNIGLLIKVNWNKLGTSSVNIPASSSHIGIDAYAAIKDHKLEKLNGSYVYRIHEEKQPTYFVDEKYINSYGKAASWAINNIRYYPVEANCTYRIYGWAWCRSDYPIISFADTAQTSQFRPLLMSTGNNTGSITVYNYKYTAPRNGYLAICGGDDESPTYIYNMHIDFIDEASLTINNGIFDDSVEVSKYRGSIRQALANHTGKFIPEARLLPASLSSIDNPAFCVDVYPVYKNELVILFAEMTRMAGDSYPIVCFGKSNNVPETVIIDGDDGGHYRPYNVQYVPQEDGYIFIASKTDYDKIRCYSTAKRIIRMQAYGDSITDNEINTWGAHRTWLNWINVVDTGEIELHVENCSYGGAQLSNQNAYSVVNRLIGQNGSDQYFDSTCDVAVISAGTNDWAGNRTIGDMTSGNTTIKGAVKEIIEYISNNSTVLPIFVTPMQRYNSVDQERSVNEDGEPINDNGYTIRNVCDAIEEVCNFYAVPCIRQDKILGINRLNIGRVSSDGLHPEYEVCDRRQASIIYSEILKFFR